MKETRICEREGCSNPIKSIRRRTRTCSLECGYNLRGNKWIADDNSLNSNSNELIRTINKFLLMKAA